MPSFFENPTQSLTPEQAQRALKAHETRIATNSSTGPRTPEGKAISSQNALKHGFASPNPVIDIEDQEAWNSHLSAYMNRFKPVDQTESDVVRRAALAMWKLDRLTGLETALFNLELQYHHVKTDAILTPAASPVERMAVAFKESAGDRAFDLCRRYLLSASREHDHAIRTFYFLESKRPASLAAAPAVPAKSSALATTAPTGSSSKVSSHPQATENTREPNELPPQQENTSTKPAILPFERRKKA